MRNAVLVVCLFGLMLANPTRLLASGAKLSKAQTEEIRVAKSRGERLFAQDRRAWIASDLLSANKKIARPSQQTYIALEADADGVARVLWVDTAAESVFAEVVFQARADLNACAKAQRKARCKGIEFSAVSRALTPSEVSLLAAANTLSQSSVKTCTNLPPNFALLKDGDGLLGYVLSSRDSFDTVILGGHTRLKLSLDGKRILATEPLFKNCLIVTKDSNQGKPAMQFATTLVADIVHEGLVFAALDDQSLVVVGGKAKRMVAIEPNGSAVKIVLVQ
jgi:hypothetical protein